MKLYKVKIEPRSDFATTLRGDTLFGQICWSVSYLYGQERISDLLSDYEDRPFLVISDAFAPGYLPKPSLPSRLLGENIEEKKSNRKKAWLKPADLQSGIFGNAITDREADNETGQKSIVRNSLDYRTFNTGGDIFAPYSVIEYRMNTKEVYFLLDDERLAADELAKVISFVGEHGYGKDSSIGKGRFTVGAVEEVNFSVQGKRFMTLGPSALEGMKYKGIWYDTFVRFGKHGGKRAFANAFKRPLLMADCGAVVETEEPVRLQYIGKGIKGISPAYPDTVHQGYAIVISIGEAA